MPSNISIAHVTHPVLKQPPILSPGDLTPEAVAAWATACQQYFLHAKSIAPADRISFVVAGLQDPLIQAWWNIDKANLSTMTWDDFLQEICAEFLPDNWDRTVRPQMLHMKMSSDQSFASFARAFETKNTLLAGTALHYTSSSLRDEITARLTERLQAHAYTASVLGITSYTKWKKSMVEEDGLWITKRNGEAEELAAKLAKISFANTKTPSSYSPYSSSTSTQSNASTSDRTPVPTLTNPERALLKEHKGCFKCRRFYAGHRHDDCTEWPSRPYKALTSADTLAAQKAYNANAAKPQGKSVAAVNVATPSCIQECEDDDDDSEDFAYNPVPVAAVYASFVGALGTDTDDTWNSDSAYVRGRSPHLIWRARLSCSSLDKDEPLLIDTGAPANLISAATVAAHNLRLRPLPQPMPFSNAFSGEELIATQWVRMSISSTCGGYSSRSMRFIVVPEHCYPVILGVPFLAKNKLLVDMHRRALWLDGTTTNILNLPPACPCPPMPSPVSRCFDLRE